MASRMNSIDLNRIKIDPRTGEKFSFNVDIHVVAATFINISQLILTRIQWPVEWILAVLSI